MIPANASGDNPAWKVQMNATDVFSTCRLMVLTHPDYDGKAAEMLKEHLYDAAFALPRTKDGLEYRTFMCVARLATTVFSRFTNENITSIEDQWETVVKLQRQSRNRKTLEWTIAYLRLGEMQGLQALKQIAFSRTREMFPHIDATTNKDPAYMMSDKPCDRNTIPVLLESAMEDLRLEFMQAVGTSL